jgi:hypothetical protein
MNYFHNVNNFTLEECQKWKRHFVILKMLWNLAAFFFTSIQYLIAEIWREFSRINRFLLSHMEKLFSRSCWAPFGRGEDRTQYLSACSPTLSYPARLLINVLNVLLAFWALRNKLFTTVSFKGVNWELYSFLEMYDCTFDCDLIAKLSLVLVKYTQCFISPVYVFVT